MERQSFALHSLDVVWLDHFPWFVGYSQVFAIKMLDCEVDSS